MAFFPKILIVALCLNLAWSFPSPSKIEEDSLATAAELTNDEEPIGNMDERGIYFGGDMIFAEDHVQAITSGLKDTRKRWPNKTVPYKWTGKFSADDRSTITKAMAMISSKTCIKFKEQTNEKDYVSVENGNSGCYSYVGRIGGKQVLNLGNGCVYKAIPAHEFIHALGFEHEHSRTDRDDYVTINWDNIEKKYQYAFDKYGSDKISPFGVTYDYGSVMHYGSTAFAIDYNKPTIIVKDSKARIGQRDGLSDKDAQKIKNMYGC